MALLTAQLVYLLNVYRTAITIMLKAKAIVIIPAPNITYPMYSLTESLLVLTLDFSSNTSGVGVKILFLA